MFCTRGFFSSIIVRPCCQLCSDWRFRLTLLAASEMGEKSKVPYVARAFLPPALWETVREFAHLSGRSIFDQQRFLFEAGCNASRRLENFRPLSERDWGPNPEVRDDRFRTKFAFSKQDRSLLVERQVTEEVRYTVQVREAIAVAVEAALTLPEPERYAAKKETIADIIVRRYRYRYRHIRAS